MTRIEKKLLLKKETVKNLQAGRNSGVIFLKSPQQNEINGGSTPLTSVVSPWISAIGASVAASVAASLSYFLGKKTDSCPPAMTTGTSDINGDTVGTDAIEGMPDACQRFINLAHRN